MIRMLGLNLLESPLVTSITTTAMLAGTTKTLFYDRDRREQGKAAAAGVFNVDVVFSVAQTIAAVGLVNHNLGATVGVYVDTASTIGTTLVRTLGPIGIDPSLTAWGGHTGTKLRLSFGAFASALALGEILVGVARDIARDPLLASEGRATLGNVRRYFTPAKSSWAVSRGAKRAGLPYRWRLTGAELAILELAFDDVAQSAKTLLVMDPGGTARWMYFVKDRLDPVPIGADLYELDVPFEEAL